MPFAAGNDILKPALIWKNRFFTFKVKKMDLSILVTKAQNGDGEAFALVCRRFEGLVKKHVFQAHLRPLYEDAQAEAWLAVAEAVGTYDGSGGVPFAGYVAGRVRYAVWNLFKRERRRWQTELPAGDDDDGMPIRLELFADSVDVAAEAERRYLRDGLRRAIGRLPERQRQAVVLTLLDNHSLSEAARRLGVTAQAVHSLRKRGLERLKKDCAGIL